MTRWDEVRGNLVDWYAVAADRTGTWTRLGVRHYDKYGIHRRRERLLQELGAHTQRLLTVEGISDLEHEPTVQEVLARLAALDGELRAKEEEIAAMRRRSGARTPEDEPHGASRTLPPATLESREESQPGA